jgi:hypothetical protein
MNAAAKERLLKMREDAIARALRQGPGAYQVAVVDAVLAMVDEPSANAEPASRAVVADGGQTIRLTLYAGTGLCRCT